MGGVRIDGFWYANILGGNMRKICFIYLSSLIIINGCASSTKTNLISSEDAFTEIRNPMQRESVLKIAQIADSIAAVHSIDYMFLDRKIYDKPEVYEVSYWECRRIGTMEIDVNMRKPELIIKFIKGTLQIEGVYI
jgi:hypothetical protein